MALHTLVCIEPEFIRIITARSRGKGMRVERSLTLPQDEFDAFLACDRSSAYQIVVNPADALYETITIPPVKPALINTLVLSEIRRLYTELPPFSLAFQPIDEVFTDGKTMRRIACCMVPEQYLESVLEPFVRFNKPVCRIVSLPFILARMVCDNDHEGAATMLCAHDGKLLKTIFLLEKGGVTLVRHVPSEAYGWDNFDLQNISMTMDYCFQSLRVQPSKCLALNCGEAEAPLTAFDSPLIRDYPDLSREYLPLLAVMSITTGAAEDLRPAAYRAEYGQQTLLNKGILLFSVASAISATILAATFFIVISLRSDIDNIRRQERTLQVTLDAYQKARQELEGIEPLITTANAVRAEPSLPALLAMFPGPPSSPMRLTSLKTVKEKGIVTLTLSGIIPEPTYAAMQSHFEALCASLEKMRGIRIVSKQLNATARTFSLEATQGP